MNIEAKRSRRGKSEIYGDILEAVDSEVQKWGIAQLTRTQLISNLAYDRFKESILKLQEGGLVAISEQQGESSSITISPAGREYLDHYRSVKKFLDNYKL